MESQPEPTGVFVDSCRAEFFERDTYHTATPQTYQERIFLRPSQRHDSGDGGHDVVKRGLELTTRPQGPLNVIILSSLVLTLLSFDSAMSA